MEAMIKKIGNGGIEDNKKRSVEVEILANRIIFIFLLC
jgi:hypothetical protein